MFAEDEDDVLAMRPIVRAIRHAAGGAANIKSVRYQAVGGVDPRRERGANDAITIEHGTGRLVSVIPCMSTQESVASCEQESGSKGS